MKDPATFEEPPLDIGRDGTGYMVIPERGLLLERTGTLITHTGYDAAWIIFQLPRPNTIAIVLERNPELHQADCRSRA